jgi:hypothetical protein
VAAGPRPRTQLVDRHAVDVEGAGGVVLRDLEVRRRARATQYEQDKCQLSGTVNVPVFWVPVPLNRGVTVVPPTAGSSAITGPVRVGSALSDTILPTARALCGQDPTSHPCGSPSTVSPLSLIAPDDPTGRTARDRLSDPRTDSSDVTLPAVGLQGCRAGSAQDGSRERPANAGAHRPVLTVPFASRRLPVQLPVHGMAS